MGNDDYVYGVLSSAWAIFLEVFFGSCLLDGERNQIFKYSECFSCDWTTRTSKNISVSVRFFSLSKFHSKHAGLEIRLSKKMAKNVTKKEKRKNVMVYFNVVLVLVASRN